MKKKIIIISILIMTSSSSSYSIPKDSGSVICQAINSTFEGVTFCDSDGIVEEGGGDYQASNSGDRYKIDINATEKIENARVKYLEKLDKVRKSKCEKENKSYCP